MRKMYRKNDVIDRVRGNAYDWHCQTGRACTGVGSLDLSHPSARMAAHEAENATNSGPGFLPLDTIAKRRSFVYG